MDTTFDKLLGGLHLALQRSSATGHVIQAFDYDQLACEVYTANHPSTEVSKVDISMLTGQSLAALRADLWLCSPSCQPYTVLNPKAQGSSDPRAASFLHLISTILPELVASGSHPTHLLVENVAGFETSNTRQILLSTLSSLHYATFECLLTPLQFGIPNSRMRYYLLAKQSPLAFNCPSEGEMWKHIPGRGEPWLDPRFGKAAVTNAIAVEELCDYLDGTLDGSPRDPHSVPDKVLVKWGRLFDIVYPSSRRTCCFTRGYARLVERSGSILQMNESLDTSSTFTAFVKSQLSDPSILRDLRLRYFSPTELLRLFHIESPRNTESKFIWPDGVSMKTKYRLIGNSINVKVVTELINFLYEEGNQ